MKQIAIAMMAMMTLLLACATTGPTYKVRVASGDTLVSIANRYGTSWDGIARLNGIKDYREIKVGDELLVRPGPAGMVVKGTVQNETFLGEANPEEIKNFNNRNKVAVASPEMSALTPKPTELEHLIKENEKLKIDALEQWPVEGDISSTYGQRGRRFHYGIDIKAPKGTPIQAVAAGKVVFSGRNKRYGRVVILEHEGGSGQTVYAHCSKLMVKQGEIVEAGKVLGLVGRSGNATGVHLHFEYKMADGSAVDPLAYLPVATYTSLTASTEDTSINEF